LLDAEGRRIALWDRARKAAKHWFADSRAQADAGRDGALRRVGADILNEPIPEKLLEALHGERGEAEAKPKRRN
jgi:hypothetical protein